MEAGKLFHIHATYIITFNRTLYGIPLAGAASFRSVKNLTSEHQQA